MDADARVSDEALDPRAGIASEKRDEHAIEALFVQLGGDDEFNDFT
jgi:hypothetical protein